MIELAERPMENGTPPAPEKYADQLSQYVLESCQQEEAFHFLSFEALQRRNIVHLQNKLALIKTRVRKSQQSSEDDEQLQSTLQNYVNAIRDYAYTQSHIPLPYDEMIRRNLRLKRNFKDLNDTLGKPFDSHYFYIRQTPSPHETDSVRSILRHILPVRLTYSSEERKARELEFESGKPAHGVSELVDRLARFSVAFVGGSFLLVPMIVMVLAPGSGKPVSASTVWSLATTSAAVLLFAAALAFGMRATNVETMVATATYAAVLVVFVGTSIQLPSTFDSNSS